MTQVSDVAPGPLVSNKGPGRLQRGDNHKNVKMEWGHLKIVFSRITWPILTGPSTNHPWVKEIQFYFQMKGISLQGEIIAKK
jgi:hypothetical protein